MTPIKSLAMIKRSLGKAFMCKSHLVIMIHSGVSCCSHVCYGTSQPFILGLGGGLAKTEKQNHAHEKKEKKMVHKEAWENVYASLTYFWDLYDGNVRKEILILFNPIRMKSVE